MLSYFNHRYIRRFSKVWVPDYPDHAMAGKLSVQHHLLKNVEFIGNLSRFESESHTGMLYDKMILLSGPEPQRSKLEALIMGQLEQTSERILIVRGKPGSAALQHPNSCIRIENHLSKTALQQAMQQSDVLICRSGYSTIMDLIKLKKTALLVPTPGQTEQEYLARFLSEKKWFTTMKQSDLELNKATLMMKNTEAGTIPDFDLYLYKKAIDDLLQSHG
ncbi:MAG: hypothetical protein IT257_10605 [Chitinophagaceae bacterium]|nr:hypothetical protein [Chitinophagaceae bacterium]